MRHLLAESIAAVLLLASGYVADCTKAGSYIGAIMQKLAVTFDEPQNILTFCSCLLKWESANNGHLVGQWMDFISRENLARLP